MTEKRKVLRYSFLLLFYFQNYFFMTMNTSRLKTNNNCYEGDRACNYQEFGNQRTKQK